MRWWGIPANVHAYPRQGGVLITGCMHFLKCRTINLWNCPLPPIPPRCFICSPSLCPNHTNNYFPSGNVGALSHGYQRGSELQCWTYSSDKLAEMLTVDPDLVTREVWVMVLKRLLEQGFAFPDCSFPNLCNCSDMVLTNVSLPTEELRVYRKLDFACAHSHHSYISSWSSFLHLHWSILTSFKIRQSIKVSAWVAYRIFHKFSRLYAS